jgi:predicted glycosyltransferase
VKVWIDILTPKQANFFAEFQHRLNAKGFKTILTTRQYREVNELLELRKVKAIQVGRHGGGGLKEKLAESSMRVSELVKIVEEQDPEIAISFSSPEASRVAFGLKIPHYCISDSPHAEAVCKLSVPLSQKLFTPWVIPIYAWKKYGVNPRDIVRYRALDPAVWISGFKSDPKSADSLKLDVSKAIIVIRTPEEFAAYLSSRTSSMSGSAVEITAKLVDMAEEGSQIVVLPRYDGQGDRLKKRFGDRVIVPEHVVETAPLLAKASVFIGGGGTMTAESALLGVPAISYYPGEPTFVDRFLISYGLVDRLHDPERIAQRAVAVCKNSEFRELCRKKSSRLLQSMEDPLRIIIRRIFGK